MERGFDRITDTDVSQLRAQGYLIQELPSKLVYTVKPPPNDAPSEGEMAFCKRKARVVCCGNYASDEQSDVFASGAAAESLRSNLTYTARRRWRSGIVDVTGASPSSRMRSSHLHRTSSSSAGAAWFSRANREVAIDSWHVWPSTIS